MDTFVDSTWYFLRYLDPKNSQVPFDPEKVKGIMPVDIYIGGKEHGTFFLGLYHSINSCLKRLIVSNSCVASLLCEICISFFSSYGLDTSKGAFQTPSCSRHGYGEKLSSKRNWKIFEARRN